MSKSTSVGDDSPAPRQFQIEGFANGKPLPAARPNGAAQPATAARRRQATQSSGWETITMSGSSDEGGQSLHGTTPQMAAVSGPARSMTETRRSDRDPRRTEASRGTDPSLCELALGYNPHNESDRAALDLVAELCKMQRDADSRSRTAGGR
ncbi:hypothetical protein DV735_g3746, partial [Chaetothyriales sp. CBS 134920]